MYKQVQITEREHDIGWAHVGAVPLRIRGRRKQPVCLKGVSEFSRQDSCGTALVRSAQKQEVRGGHRQRQGGEQNTIQET